VELVSSWVDYVGIAVYVISVIFIIALAFEKGGGWGGGMLLLGAVLWPVFCLFNWERTSFWVYHAVAGLLIVYLF
jgi:hypothetical protein